MHPELDGRTLDIVNCFYNIAGHFSALIKLQILHVHAHVYVHMLFSLAALFASRARALVVFTGSTFALPIFRRFRCFCNYRGIHADVIVCIFAHLHTTLCTEENLLGVY